MTTLSEARTTIQDRIDELRVVTAGMSIDDPDRYEARQLLNGAQRELQSALNKVDRAASRLQRQKLLDAIESVRVLECPAVDA